MPEQDDPKIQRILDRIEESLPANDAKAKNYLNALRTEMKADAATRSDQQQLLEEYEKAYKQLTSPANRIGVFLQTLDGDETGLIGLGDTEYVAFIDAKLDRAKLKVGARVCLNEAYAVVDVLPNGTSGSVVRVGEVLEDGRLRIGTEMQGQSGRFVLRADALSGALIQKGDEVRLDSSGKVAIEHFMHQDTRDYFYEAVEPVAWNEVGGQEQAIQLIQETIEQPLLYPEIYERFEKKPVKGILLYGPPGCGKTLIGKATAYNLAKQYSERVGHEVQEYFMHISGPKILNMWLGETERMVREIFEVARSKAKEGRLVVIFMDEAESILRTRSSGRWLNISNTVVPQFCAEMDGLVALENVVLILTSNRPDYIDPAILRPERIDRKVKVRRPSFDDCRAIFSIYLHDRLPFDPELLAANDNEAACARKELIERALSFLWRKEKATEFLRVYLRNGSTEVLHWRDLVSGALLKSVVERAKDTAIRRAIAAPTENHGIRVEDLESALDDEYRENEIFPKSEVLEDWLKLLDLEPESVMTIKPIRPSRGEDILRNSVI